MTAQPEPEVEYWSHAEALKRDAAFAAKAAAGREDQAREDQAREEEARRGGRPLRRWSSTPVGQMELLVCQSARSVRKGLRIVEKLDLALPTALSEVMQSGGKSGNATSAFSQDLVTSLVIAAGAAWQGVVLRMVILNEAIAAYVRVAEAYKTIRATETMGLVPAANCSSKSKQKRGFSNTGHPSDAPDYVAPISEVRRARGMRGLLHIPDDEFPAPATPPPAPAANETTPVPTPLPVPEEPEKPSPQIETIVFEPDLEPDPSPQPQPPAETLPAPGPYLTYHQSYRDRLEEKPICLFI